MLTPVERRGDYWVKRDDAYEFGGVRGGKVRTCRVLAQGAAGLVTAGAYGSPQVNIVAHVARALGIPCRAHIPSGKLSPEAVDAQAVGADIVQHRAGYNSVLIRRSQDDAAERGWRLIPFGMECQEAVTQTAAQVANLPAEVKRLVVPVGSGMSLAGILWGLKNANRAVKVVGVRVGANPAERLNAYAPWDWPVRCRIVGDGKGYGKAAALTEWGGIVLDPHYEAKCLPYLRPGDCFWVVGIRRTATADPSLENFVQENDPVPQRCQNALELSL